MKALIDTNIVLDFLCKRTEFFENANIIFQHCFSDVNGVLAGHTVSNLFYILKNRYNYSLEQCKTKIRNLCTLFEIAEINKNVILEALDNNNFSDLEDSLQNACARAFNVDYIVTRNIDDFKDTRIPVVNPEEFIIIVRNMK
ncbi:MAG: PIN domain-containing protein [Treponema sp.]|nr:PIN domain-containing protein [Treponema sp.]